MKKNFTNIIFIFGLQFFFIKSMAALVPNVRPFSPRIMGMGGAFIGLSDDTFALHYNPAGLLINDKHGMVQDKGILTLLEFGVKVRADLLAPYETNYRKWFEAIKDPKHVERLEIIELNNDLKDKSTVQEQLALFDKVNGRNIGAGVQAPFNISYAGNGWGFAYNALSADISLAVYEKITPIFSASVKEASIVKFGYALPFTFWDRPLYLGATFKYQSIAYIDRTGTDAITIDTIDASQSNTENYIKNMLYMGQGPGLDWGALWKYSPDFSLGLSLLNLVSFLRPVTIQGYGGRKTQFIAPIVTLGVCYEPGFFLRYLRRNFLGKILTDLKLLADYEINFDGSWSFWKGFHMGVETGWFGNPAGWSFLYIRGGINQGYFTWGLGLDLYVVKLDYAYYQEELGPYPGNLRETLHTLSFRVEW